MNKNHKIISGVVIVFLIGSTTLYYYGQKVLDKQDKQIQEHMAKIQTFLPPTVTQNNQLKKGIFSSSGVYTLTYQEPIKKTLNNTTEANTPSRPETETITVNYKIKHGLWTYFGADMEVEANTILEGTLLKNVKIEGDFLKTTGTISKNGDINLNSKSSNIVLQEENTSLKEKTTIVLSPFTSTMVYHKELNEIKTQTNISHILATQQTEGIKFIKKIEIKEANFNREFNLEQPQLGVLNIQVANIQTQLGNLMGLELTSKMVAENDKYNINTTIKTDNIKIMAAKEPTKLDISYSIKGLNKEVINHYYSLSRLNKLTEKEGESEIETKNNMLKLLKSGMNIHLEKFNIDGILGHLEMSGEYHLKPTAENQDLSLENQSMLALEIKTQGGITPMIARTAFSLFGVEPGDNNKGNQFKINGVYEKGTLNLNGKPSENTYLINKIQNYFANIDNVLKKENINPMIQPTNQDKDIINTPPVKN